MDSFTSWKMNGSGMEKEEREETPLQGEDESRRSSPPYEAMDKSLEEEINLLEYDWLVARALEFFGLALWLRVL